MVIRSSNEICFLVMLYGTLEYDGRVKRLLDVLSVLGNVSLVDVASHAETSDMRVQRRSVEMPKMIGTARRHIRFWRTAVAEAIRIHPKVIVGANFFTTFPAWMASRITGAYLVYDAYELIIPESGVSMTRRNYYWYCMERLAVRSAHLVIAANEDRARLMQEHYGLNQRPTVMRNIPPVRENVADSLVLARYPELTHRNSHERVVIYQGDVSFLRGIDRFVQALAFLPPEFRMIVAGGGPDLERLRTIGYPFEREGRLHCLGKIENHLLPAITRMAHVGIVTYPFHGQNNIYCAPNKIFEYAQAGLPVVATDQPPLYRMVKDYGIGRVVSEHDTPQKVAAVIQEVAKNKEGYRGALERFLDDHRWEDEAARTRKAVVEMLEKTRSSE